MSLKIKHTLYSLATTGLLLTGICVAGASNHTMIHSAATTVMASRRRAVRPAKNTRISLATAKRLHNTSSFVALRYSSNKSFKQNIKMLNRANVTYGAYAVNGNANTARQLIKLAPKASFYMDTVPNKGNNINNRAEAFGKTALKTKKPDILYLANASLAKGINDSTRNQFSYNFISGHNHSGANIWQFKGYWAKRFGNIVSHNKFSKTMPVEIFNGGNTIQPLNKATSDALNDGYNNDIDNGMRALTAGGTQQWQHDYEKYIHQGPRTNDKLIAKAVGVSKKNLYKKPSNHESKHFNKYRNEMARMSKKYNNIRLGASSGTNSGNQMYYKPSQMRNAYVSMRSSLNGGRNGTDAPDGCEAASMDMGLHLLGLNKSEHYYNLLEKIPWTYAKNTRMVNKYSKYHNPTHNPEKGYSNDPFVGGTGASLYPQALTSLARSRKARNSQTLIDSKKHNGMNDKRNVIIKALQRGHPIVIEATHDMKNSNSDHVILLWGYKNGKFYWCDPNDAKGHIPNSGGTPVSWNYLKNIMNGYNKINGHWTYNKPRGPRAVILAH